jgi:hypothetical protein
MTEMTDKPSQPLTKADAFEAEYLAYAARARLEFTWKQRRAIIGVLSGVTPDLYPTAPETPQPALRSFALILARCESAATLLGWRKQITPGHKRLLDAAVHRLQEAAAKVAVCANAVQPAHPQRAKFSPLLRIPGR